MNDVSELCSLPAPLSTLAQDNALGTENRLGTFRGKCQVCDPAFSHGKDLLIEGL